MSPIEHYFENLLTRGSDIKGEPNKNALSKEVQEAIEICAYYIKSINAIPNDSNSEKAAMLTEIQQEIDGEAWTRECLDGSDERIVEMESVNKIIQQKISDLKGEDQ